MKEIEETTKENAPLSSYETSEKGHGRDSTWKVEVFDATQSVKVTEWKDLKRFIKVERIRISKEEKSENTCFFMSDFIPENHFPFEGEDSAKYFHLGIREHWGIENKLHWVKDVIHNEDENGISGKNAPMNLSIVSTIALNIHRKNRNESISYGQMKFGANVKDIIELLRT